MSRASLTTTDLALALGEQHEDSLMSLHAWSQEDAKSLLMREMHEWPTVGTTSKLGTFATNRDAYRAFLAFLANGVRVVTAASSIGIMPKEVEGWLGKGITDLNASRNTVYAWFYRDCFQARGSSKTKAEIAAFQADPIGFIKRIDQGGQYNDIEAAGIDALFRHGEGERNDEQEVIVDSNSVTDMFRSLAEKGITDLSSFHEEAAAQVPTPPTDESE